MAERNAPEINSYTITGAETLVYEAKQAPIDVPVSIFNAGSVVVKIRFDGNTSYLPLMPQTGMTCNPSPRVYATTDSGSSTVITATGVSTFASGVTATGAALSTAESQAIAAAHTQKSLLVEILLQEKLQTELLKLVADVELTVSDFPSWRIPE